jgi:hypothetical protein
LILRVEKCVWGILFVGVEEKLLLDYKVVGV